MDGPLFGYDPPGANVLEASGSGEPSSRGARTRCPKGTLRPARFRSNEQSRACVDSATATAHAFAPVAERDDCEGGQPDPCPNGPAVLATRVVRPPCAGRPGVG